MQYVSAKYKMNITSSSTGLGKAVTFFAKRRKKGAIQNLRGELSVMFLKFE